MSQKSAPTESSGGNTNSPSSSFKNQCIHWFFTWNNYPPNSKDILSQKFNIICSKYCFQYEIGEEGTKHIQGVISLNKKARWTEFKLPNTIHWEPVKSLKDAYLYCCKDDTRQPDTIPITMNYKPPKPLKLITPDKMWQQHILNIIAQEPDERKVHWFWSEKGGIGKSSFCKYLVAKHNALFFEEGKKTDIMHLIFEHDMDQCDLVVIDIPRANGNNLSYKAIESIKNGLIYSPKYEGGYKLFNAPHLIIFANEYPQYDKLSKDRWCIMCLDIDTES